MTIELTEQELIEAVSNFLLEKGINFNKKLITFDCEYDADYDSKPHDFSANVELT